MNVQFGSFTLNGLSRQLLAGAQPIHLSPRAFELLALLVARRPEAISKAEIHRRLWPDTFVSDVNVAVLVAEIRDALGETARQHRFVRTVHRFGYAFSGAASENDAAAGDPAGAMYLLAWSTQRVPLRPGENVIGRDPRVDVRMDTLGVSRRHAVIALTGGGAELRDLSSKNGTYVDGVRVTAPVKLIDGAEIRLGSTSVCFRRITGGRSTETLL